MHLITGKNGTDHVTSANDGFRNAEIFGDGNYIFDASGDFYATKISNNKIRISSGVGIMGGRFFELNDFVELDIISGTEGIKRKDLVCVRYTKNENTQIESVELVVITGERATDNPPLPEYHTEKITDGALISDFPIYRLDLNGVNMTFTRLFELKQGIPIEFVEASVDEAIESGETLTTLFGKIKKRFSTIISKLGTATLTTTAQDLSGAVNELNGPISHNTLLYTNATTTYTNYTLSDNLNNYKCIVMGCYVQGTSMYLNPIIVPIPLLKSGVNFTSSYTANNIMCGVKYVNDTTLSVQQFGGYPVRIFGIK